jgi:hypothetical protein
MSIENLGYGGGGSIVGALLAWLGFKQRLDRMEKEHDELRKGVVYADTCKMCDRSSHENFGRIDKKFEQIDGRFDYMDTKLDTILGRLSARKTDRG